MSRAKIEVTPFSAAHPRSSSSSYHTIISHCHAYQQLDLRSVIDRVIGYVAKNVASLPCRIMTNSVFPGKLEKSFAKLSLTNTTLCLQKLVLRGLLLSHFYIIETLDSGTLINLLLPIETLLFPFQKRLSPKKMEKRSPREKEAKKEERRIFASRTFSFVLSRLFSRSIFGVITDKIQCP